MAYEWLRRYELQIKTNPVHFVDEGEHFPDYHDSIINIQTIEGKIQIRACADSNLRLETR
jgi:hypothetical protein